MTFWSASRSVYHSVTLFRKGRLVQFPASAFCTVMLVMVMFRCVRFTGASVSMTTSVPSLLFASGRLAGGCWEGSCIPEANTAAIMTTLATTPTNTLSPACRVPFSIVAHSQNEWCRVI